MSRLIDTRLTFILEAIDMGNPSPQHTDETITPHRQDSHNNASYMMRIQLFDQTLDVYLKFSATGTVAFIIRFTFDFC